MKYLGGPGAADLVIEVLLPGHRNIDQIERKQR